MSLHVMMQNEKDVNLQLWHMSRLKTLRQKTLTQGAGTCSSSEGENVTPCIASGVYEYHRLRLKISQGVERGQFRSASPHFDASLGSARQSCTCAVEVGQSVSLFVLAMLELPSKCAITTLR